jgi:hypothetical protein
MTKQLGVSGEGFVSFVSQNRGGRPPKLALEPVIKALSNTANSVTKASIQLGCHRRTLHRFIQKHPDVQDHRKQVIEEVCDEARSNIIRAVMARNLYASFKWLKAHHPDWA